MAVLLIPNFVNVPKLVKEELVKLEGKMVSFLVKHCGIGTPRIEFVNELCKVPDMVKLFENEAFQFC